MTICTYLRECIFGAIVDEGVLLNTLGCIVETHWRNIPNHFQHVELDDFVIMPNHLHGIIVISKHSGAGEGRRGDLIGRPYNVRDISNVAITTDSNPSHTARPKGPLSGSIGAIVAQFKRISAMKINRVRGSTAAPVWQRSYYEHIIRDENSLNTIRAYIQTNPAHWVDDDNNPNRLGD